MISCHIDINCINLQLVWQQMALIYEHHIFRGDTPAVCGLQIWTTDPSSITMADSKFCHWCEMGFFRKSALHAISCPLRSLKRKRQDDLADMAEFAIYMVVSTPKRHGTFGPPVPKAYQVL